MILSFFLSFFLSFSLFLLLSARRRDGVVSFLFLFGFPVFGGRFFVDLLG